jgi:hypothetical protein
MPTRQQQFDSWKTKVNLFNNFYNDIIQQWKLTMPWKDYNLSYNIRYKLWKKHYKKYTLTKSLFYNKLHNTIFMYNITLSNLTAIEIFNSIKTI